MCTFVAVEVWLLYFTSNGNLAKSAKFRARAPPNSIRWFLTVNIVQNGYFKKLTPFHFVQYLKLAVDKK